MAACCCAAAPSSPATGCGHCRPASWSWAKPRPRARCAKPSKRQAPTSRWAGSTPCSMSCASARSICSTGRGCARRFSTQAPSRWRPGCLPKPTSRGMRSRSRPHARRCAASSKTVAAVRALACTTSTSLDRRARRAHHRRQLRQQGVSDADTTQGLRGGAGWSGGASAGAARPSGGRAGRRLAVCPHLRGRRRPGATRPRGRSAGAAVR
mmetsp:Transcript_61330/g.144970  ORF Transcript_61330/g.144970 Transcript_61330/m.144970 type:complete len:210 (+) Transcript_61330:98-727(+)